MYTTCMLHPVPGTLYLYLSVLSVVRASRHQRALTEGSAETWAYPSAGGMALSTMLKGPMGLSALLVSEWQCCRCSTHCTEPSHKNQAANTQPRAQTQEYSMGMLHAYE